ncbi:MAG: hypothetical protein ABJB69_07485 [Spartobacteria bacterium]
MAESIEKNHPRLRAAIEAQREVTGGWMRNADVIGTAVTVDPAGNSALVVYVNREAAKAADAVRSLPVQWRGVPVEVRLTDKFRALRRRRRSPTPSVTTSHRAMQSAPIQLGTSGSWGNDSTLTFCCGGTLGALVQIGGVQYILSNYHVFEGDIALGKNNALATTGDAIVQPGLLDTHCDPDSVQVVGLLETRSSLPDSNVDCSIAKVTPGMVRSDGAILEVGTISSQTVPAFLNQRVKKSGRTTGLTRSSIMGLNATIVVDYDYECGGNLAFSKTFTGQIVVSNPSSTFVNGGDSGSVLLEDVATNPRAIGLIYAGSNVDAIANPIDEVLTFLGATMVGN